MAHPECTDLAILMGQIPRRNRAVQITEDPHTDLVMKRVREDPENESRLLVVFAENTEE
ncbi:MAG: hypothetical protein V4473_02455 [Patescibacteria group bacterium]